jgi:aspartate/tyrosine/aromatic aminotransferase
MTMFEAIEVAPADPILGLTEAFQRDTRSGKINLSVGVFKDERGQTPVLQSVKAAEKRLVDTETTKSYLPITGAVEYDRQVQTLLLGTDHPLLEQQRAVTLQAPGGTGALRVAADFIHQRFPKATVWCSSPTWDNHPKIFASAGLAVDNYPYLDSTARALDFDAMLTKIQRIPAGDVVLLHGCCHNPSGVDLSPEQWQRVAEVMVERKLLPLVDFAYQGFGTGLHEDAVGLRVIADVVPEALVASSFSKNFGLYRDRVGALTALGTSAASADAVLSHLKVAVRTNYSNPPAHGALVVETILADPGLRAEWEQELAAMRDRIHQMRELFVRTMRQQMPHRDFGFLLDQRGMFSFSGLTGDQVDQLKTNHAIYIVRSGRINVAGITPDNIEPLCKGIAAVL